MAHSVDTAVEAMKVPSADQPVDDVLRDSELEQLCPGHHAMLTPRHTAVR